MCGTGRQARGKFPLVGVVPIPLVAGSPRFHKPGVAGSSPAAASIRKIGHHPHNRRLCHPHGCPLPRRTDPCLLASSHPR